jgi:hypothetical protein
MIEEDVKALGAQMGAVARLLLIADLLGETSVQPLLLLKLKTRLEGLLRGRFIYDSRWAAPSCPPLILHGPRERVRCCWPLAGPRAQVAANSAGVGASNRSGSMWVPACSDQPLLPAFRQLGRRV